MMSCHIKCRCPVERSTMLYCHRYRRFGEDIGLARKCSTFTAVRNISMNLSGRQSWWGMSALHYFILTFWHILCCSLLFQHNAVQSSLYLHLATSEMWHWWGAGLKRKVNGGICGLNWQLLVYYWLTDGCRWMCGAHQIDRYLSAVLRDRRKLIKGKQFRSDDESADSGWHVCSTDHVVPAHVVWPGC